MRSHSFKNLGLTILLIFGFVLNGQNYYDRRAPAGYSSIPQSQTQNQYIYRPTQRQSYYYNNAPRSYQYVNPQTGSNYYYNRTSPQNYYRYTTPQTRTNTYYRTPSQSYRYTTPQTRTNTYYRTPSQSYRYTTPQTRTNTYYRTPSQSYRYTTPQVRPNNSYRAPTQSYGYTTPQVRQQNYSYNQNYANPSPSRQPNVQMQFNNSSQNTFQYQSLEQQKQAMEAAKEHQENADLEFNVQRSGGWREHPLSLATQKTFEHLPSAAQNHIEQFVNSFCDSEDHSDHTEANKYKCREAQIGSYARHSHVDNHFENQFKQQVELHKQEFMQKLLQAKERMLHNKDVLQEHSIHELCGHLYDRRKEKECEEFHTKSLLGLDKLSFGHKALDPEVLNDVKKHMESFGSNIPFMHNELKTDGKKGGAAGMLGGMLKGLF